MASFRELAQRWRMPEERPTVQQLVTAASQPERATPFSHLVQKREREMDLTVLRLPKESLPTGNGRGRTFEVRKVPERTIDLCNTLLMATNTDAKSMASLYETFQRFSEVNVKQEKDVRFMLFLVDIVVQGIKPSSAVTYGKTLLAAFSREASPLVSPLINGNDGG